MLIYFNVLEDDNEMNGIWLKIDLSVVLILIALL